MPYPTVEDTSARAWWRAWKELTLMGERPERCDPPEPPDVITLDAGGDYDWEEIGREAVSELSGLLMSAESTATFETDSCVRLHMRLPRDSALADPGFWAWFAIVPGIALVLARYGPTEKLPLPDSQNFSTASGKETLFYRLWIRVC